MSLIQTEVHIWPTARTIHDVILQFFHIPLMVLSILKNTCVSLRHSMLHAELCRPAVQAAREEHDTVGHTTLALLTLLHLAY